MTYEIVELKEKIVAGFSSVTSNDAPDMGEKIGGLWQKLYSGPAQSMADKVNAKAIGLYCDYGIPTEKSYTVLAGCEVSSKDSAEKQGLDVKIIPAGKYAKFVVKGDVRLAVAQAWGEIWNTPLDRTFTGDFEEYQEDSDGQTATIFIYIAVK